MNVTWDEANQIVAQMIYEESLAVDAHTQERMASVIFSHRGQTWDHHNQEWIVNDEISRLQGQVEGLNEALKLRVSQADKMSRQIDAIRGIVG